MRLFYLVIICTILYHGVTLLTAVNMSFLFAISTEQNNFIIIHIGLVVAKIKSCIPLAL